MKLNAKQQEHYAKLTEHFIAMVETNGANWKRPWTRVLGDRPFNPTTDHTFQGANSFFLGLMGIVRGYPTNQWATFKQWKKQGGNIIKGQKGTMVLRPRFVKVQGDDGDDEQRLIGFSDFYVFNRAQVEGLTEPEPAPDVQTEPNYQAASRWVENLGIAFQTMGQACYMPGADTIGMPPFEAFIDEPNYWSTLLHEITHWTGHKSRLDRFSKQHETGGYAFEELIAELGSCYLAADLGIPGGETTEENSGAYLAGWLKHLKEDPDALRRAAGQAIRATTFAHDTSSKAAQAA